MTHEDQAADYRHRLRCDFEALARDYMITLDEGFLEDLIDTAMHPIEALLVRT